MDTREWQPIDTAPKTNHAIMIYCPKNYNQYQVYWSNVKDAWVSFLGDKPIFEKVTHWMPLAPDPKPPFTPEQRKAMANELGQVWQCVSPEVRVLIRDALRLYKAPAQWLTNTEGWISLDIINPDNLSNLAFRIPLTWEPKE